MMNKHEISLLFPDHIHGQLPEHERNIVDEALRTSPELKAEYDEFVHVFSILNQKDILSNMEKNSENIVLQPLMRTLIRPPHKRPVHIFIGSATALAACLLIWIGITSTNRVPPIENTTQSVSGIEFQQVLYTDNLNGLDIKQDDLEDIMLEEVLALYVREIESDIDAPLNPILEEEITKYLLKESQDEESM